VRRVEAEGSVATLDTATEKARRRIGRPSTVEAFRAFLLAELAKQPAVLAVELLRRARLAGYAGGKSALYDLVKAIRPHEGRRPLVRFEGLPGEFSQHDFGEVDVRFLDGAQRRVHFFASRLKYSRWAQVSLVEDERVETLVRALVDHFAAVGGSTSVLTTRPPRMHPRPKCSEYPEFQGQNSRNLHQVCRRSCQRKSAVPARLSASYHAFVLTCLIGFPLKLNKWASRKLLQGHFRGSMLR